MNEDEVDEAKEICGDRSWWRSVVVACQLLHMRDNLNKN